MSGWDFRHLQVDKVRPAPRVPVVDLRLPLDEIITHHPDRLAETEKLIEEHPGSAAWEISVTLMWSRSWHEIADFMQRAVVAETLVHSVLSRTMVGCAGGAFPSRFYLPTRADPTPDGPPETGPGSVVRVVGCPAS